MSSDSGNTAGGNGDAKGSAAALPVNKRSRNYILAILTIVYVFNFIDRQILVILQESIKAEMGLSDQQLGLLSGFWFAIFYVTAGIPIARLADRANRRNIIAASLAVWSGMTALCGMVTSYWQLAAARVGVGIGEAGCSPPAHSIISDLFPFSQRATALSIYTMGIYIGITLGYLAGGWINEFFGWRMAFYVVGIPGILFAVLVRFTIREPQRGLSDGLTTAKEQPPLMQTLKTLWQYKSFRYLCVAPGLTAFMGYGIGNFTPSFLIRSYGMGTGEAALWLALLSGLGGGLGTFLGGYMADRLGKRDLRWYLWLPALGLIIGTPIRMFGFYTDQFSLAFPALMVGLVLDTLYLAPTIAACHGLVSVRLRALASSILFFVLNLIGLGGGPVFVGWLSDNLAADYGIESMRWAIIVTAVMGIIASAVYLRGAHHFKRDMAGR